MLPAIGIGVITALPDFIKSFKQGKTILSYTFYDANQQIISNKQIKITKDSKDITTTKATTNGYIKVTIVSTAKNTNFKNIIIDNATPAEDYSGSIAETMSLASGGDCMGDGGGDDELAGACQNPQTYCLKKRCNASALCVDKYNDDKKNCKTQYGSNPIALRACLDAAFEVEYQCIKAAFREYHLCTGS